MKIRLPSVFCEIYLLSICMFRQKRKKIMYFWTEYIKMMLSYYVIIFKFPKGNKYKEKEERKQLLSQKKNTLLNNYTT